MIVVVAYIYSYGMTSVLIIILYEIVILRSGLMTLSPMSLILRFLFSLMFSPILITIWGIMILSSRICINTVKDCKYQSDIDRIYIESLKKKYTDFNEMEAIEVWIVTKMAKRSSRLNRTVRRCGSIIEGYSKYTKFILRNLI